MQAWRRKTAAELHVTREARATKGALGFDVARYMKLEKVKAMPTFHERERHLAFWVEKLGATRQRTDIDKNDIEDVYLRLTTEPRSATDPRPYAVSTANNMLRALSNVWRRLDPNGSSNPVREVEELDEPKGDPQGRAIPYQTFVAILAAMEDRGRAEKKGDTRPEVSKTKIRLRCMGYSQICEGQLMRVEPEHLNLEAGTLWLTERFKGSGADPVLTPLTRPAIEAFRDFDRHNLYGPFSGSSVWKSFNTAAERAGFPPVRVHDLRHTFAAALGEASKDDRAAQFALQHGNIETTARYTQSSVDPRVRDAFTKLDAYMETVGLPIGTTDAEPSGTLLDFSAPKKSRPSSRSRQKKGRNVKTSP